MRNPPSSSHWHLLLKHPHWHLYSATAIINHAQTHLPFHQLTEASSIWIHNLHVEFLVLVSFNSGVLQRGRCILNRVDSDHQLFQSMIGELVWNCAQNSTRLCNFNTKKVSMEFSWSSFPMLKSNSGWYSKLQYIEKCFDEMFLVFNDYNKDGKHNVVVDVLLD